MKSMPSLPVIARWLWTQTWWRLWLGSVGRRAILFRPVLVSGARHIRIGAFTTIRDNARLEAIVRREVPWTPRLYIGNHVNIEQGVHIVCQCEVTIGDRVSITPYCAIVDTDHPFDPLDGVMKIGARLPSAPSKVHIGEGSFIGAHSVILPNVTIGRGCVVGAGSIVTRDLPDYCVAAGAPARVIKRFDPLTRQWNRP